MNKRYEINGNKIEVAPQVNEATISHVMLAGPDTSTPPTDSTHGTDEFFDWQNDSDYTQLESPETPESRHTGVLRYLGETTTQAAIRPSFDPQIIGRVQSLE